MDDLAAADDLIKQIEWGNISNESLLSPVVADGPFSDPSHDYVLEIQNLLMDDNDNPVLETPSDSSAKEFCDKFLADILVGQDQQDPNSSGEPAVDSPLDQDKKGEPAVDYPASRKSTRIPAAGFPAMVRGHHLPTESPPGLRFNSGVGSNASGNHGTARPKKGGITRGKK